MESQMQQLIERLENAVRTLEKKTGTMIENKDDKIPILPDYITINTQTEKIINKSKEDVKHEDLKKYLSNNNLESISLVITKQVKMMLLVMHSSLLLKKPELKEQQELFKKIEKKGNENLNSVDKSIRNTPIEKTIREVIKYMQWMFVSNVFEFLKGQRESADYFYQKVQLMKDVVVNQWYKEIQGLMDVVKSYLEQHFETGLVWRRESFNYYSYQQFLIDLDSDHITLTYQQSSLQQSSQQSQLLLQQQQIQQQQYQNEQKIEEKKLNNVVKKDKQSQKELRQNMWFLNHYKNQSLQFNEGELLMKQSIYLFDCQDCQLVVHEKINSIILEKCKNVKLQFNTLVASLETINSEKIKIQSLDHVPLINLDKTQNVEIFLPQNSSTEIITSLSSTIQVQFKDESIQEYGKCHFICTQLISKFNHEKQDLETTKYEKFS